MGCCVDGCPQTNTTANVILCALVAALVVVCCCSSAHSCEVQLCYRQYARALDEGSVTQGPTYRYCTILRSYGDCIKATARSCRGDLTYHSMNSMVAQWTRAHNCSRVIERGPQPHPNNNNHPNSNQGKSRFQRPRGPGAGPPECASYKPAGGSPAPFSHCGLFGDPHLRTFYNELQTCGVMGAWPLIDNPHLAVQVTNEAVSKGSSATATTKITVIIRQHNPCAVEKTYEAQTDYLPGVFNDRSKYSGPGVRIKEENPGHHVEIHLRYIATRVVIRKVGRYLTFAIRMPEAIAIQGAQSSTLELCLRGCPKRERIDFSQLLTQPDEIISMVTSRGHVTMPKKEALATCKSYNVTDFYFDACVFDLLTTGDSTFSVAARDAMQDVLSLYPSAVSSLKNRTVLPEYVGTVVPRGVSSAENGTPGRTVDGVLLVVLVFLLLLVSRR